MNLLHFQNAVNALSEDELRSLMVRMVQASPDLIFDLLMAPGAFAGTAERCPGTLRKFAADASHKTASVSGL